MASQILVPLVTQLRTPYTLQVGEQAWWRMGCLHSPPLPLKCGCFHSAWQPLRRSHIAHIQRPKSAFFSDEAARIWVIGSQWSRLKDKASWHPGTSWLPAWGSAGTFKRPCIDSNDNDRQATCSIPKQQRRGRHPAPCCPTQGSRNEDSVLSHLGKPSTIPWNSWFTKCGMVIPDYRSKCLTQQNSLSSLTGYLAVLSLSWFCNSSEVRPNFLICY